VSFTDADLIARVLAREDHHAFGELVRRYQSPVRGFLARMTRQDLARADDLAQETFLKAWQKLQTYRGGARFSTWLFGIAFNEFRMSARRSPNVVWPEPATAGFNEAPEPVAPAQDGHLAMDLTAALLLLSAPERAAVVLCCQNGLSHEEAAQVLDSPLGTVKTNILRGREKLRRHLSPAYEHYEAT